MSILRRSFAQLLSGSDIRGRYVATPKTAVGARSFAALAHAIGQINNNAPALTPFAAHCLGHAFASMIAASNSDKTTTTICLGRDPREHGVVLADAFCRGAASVEGVKVVYTGIATTPALFESSLCDGGVMVTASHLPSDRNGLKFFDKQGGFKKKDIQQMIGMAQEYAQTWFDQGILPPSSGSDGVFCSEVVDWMPLYEDRLKEALRNQVQNSDIDNNLPLNGLYIVLNSGNGSGGFFQKVLQDLGANVDGSIHTAHDPEFPYGVPNPENDSMIQETIKACEEAHADLGILLDTDADRCGM
ncbi:MAG: hypothetical protein SGARI_005646, partial [Bacillariaceae sp.]